MGLDRRANRQTNNERTDSNENRWRARHCAARHSTAQTRKEDNNSTPQTSTTPLPPPSQTLPPKGLIEKEKDREYTMAQSISSGQLRPILQNTMLADKSQREQGESIEERIFVRSFVCSFVRLFVRRWAPLVIIQIEYPRQHTLILPSFLPMLPSYPSFSLLYVLLPALPIRSGDDAETCPENAGIRHCSPGNRR